MTNNLGEFASCSNVAVPPLVITKINYNPSTSVSFPLSNDQEFIEIQNTGTTLVTLSGIYFSELGTSYQFPYNATISGNSSLYLASNETVFQSKYGFAPFGQFTRNLSNKSQKIVLADAFGNIIDSVEYFDTSPWPTAADGGGSYLQLTNTSLDNNLGTSWVASTASLSVSNFDLDSVITLYPNPTNLSLTVKSQFNIDKIEIYDVLGKFVKSIQVNANEIQTDVSNFSMGMYFMKIYTQYGTKTQKWFKN
jgi:hypothetical protein